MEQTTTRDAATEALKLGAPPPFFYHSAPGWYSATWEQSTVFYDRIESSTILGEPPLRVSSEESDNSISQQQDTFRCFNCGGADHKVSACPLPAHRELIALSRQYYHFFRGGSRPQWQRIHSFESHRQQRLDWLEEFQPGEIKGDLLQSALADQNEEWLANICSWGYPPGWTGDVDPRERVRTRILNEFDFDDNSLEAFEIHGEDDVEAISIHGNDLEETLDGGNDEQDESLAPELDHNTIHDTTRVKRWTKYPTRYFSSDLLLLYTPAAPSLLPPSWDDTSFVDTTAYLCQHYSFGQRPPSPAVSPPPLPPEIPVTLPLSEQGGSFPQVSLNGSESDMELSDSE